MKSILLKYAVLSAAVLAVVVPPAVTLAATLNPPAPIDARCEAGANRTLCFFQRHFELPPSPLYLNDGTPAACGGSQLLEEGPLDIQVKRTYNSAGDLAIIDCVT